MLNPIEKFKRSILHPNTVLNQHGDRTLWEFWKFCIFRNLEFIYSAHKKSVDSRQLTFCLDCRSLHHCIPWTGNAHTIAQNVMVNKWTDGRYQIYNLPVLLKLCSQGLRLRNWNNFQYGVRSYIN